MRVMLSLARIPALAFSATLLAACQPGQLYVASNTVVGLHASVNTAQTAGSLQIGYDRYFGTIVPRSVTAQGETGLSVGTAAKEAMSAMGCSVLEVDGIFVSKFTENLATGRAALNYGKAMKDANADAAKEAAEFFTCKAAVQ